MVSKMYIDYCNWIYENPVEAADYESIFKWGSLLFSGRTKSAVVPEVLYAVSNLITLHNDIVLLKKCDLLKNGAKMKICLSVLEHCEVFLEMSASYLGASKKWTVISLIQLIKCLARLHLLHYSQKGLIGNPPISPIERFTFRETYLKNPSCSSIHTRSNNSGVLFQAISEIPRKRRLKKIEINMTSKKYFAEVVFTMKPISHLAAHLWLGKLSWKPYILSMSMDLVSLLLHLQEYRRNKLHPQEQIVLSNRYFRLFLYLMRSPFYDKYFKAMMLFLFTRVFNSIPFSNFILKPLLLYLIKIQHIYFYMWSS